MAICDQQKSAIAFVSNLLGVKPFTNYTFPWMKNVHTQNAFGSYYSLIDEIFIELGGDSEAKKQIMCIPCDAYFPEPLNFILEFDEFQHFSTPRLKTLELYPKSLPIGFDIEKYKLLCNSNRHDADKYRKSKTTKDFSFSGGRTAQRAYLDCFKDILPILNGLNPTIRISEFDFKNFETVKQMIQKQLG